MMKQSLKLAELIIRWSLNLIVNVVINGVTLKSRNYHHALNATV